MKNEILNIFYVKGLATAINYTPASFNDYKYNVDLILWFNSSKQSDWQGLEKTLSDIREKMRDFPKFTIQSIVYEAEMIWDGFTLEEVEKQYFSHPFYGAKISGTIEFFESLC